MKAHLVPLLIVLSLCGGYAEEPLFSLAAVRGQPSANTEPLTWENNGKSETLNVDKKPAVTGLDIVGANVVQTEGNGVGIIIILNNRGAGAFEAMTRTAAKTRAQIAIILEGKLVSAPSVRDVISGGQIEITGSFAPDEAIRLAALLNQNWKNPRHDLHL